MIAIVELFIYFLALEPYIKQSCTLELLAVFVCVLQPLALLLLPDPAGLGFLNIRNLRLPLLELPGYIRIEHAPPVKLRLFFLVFRLGLHDQLSGLAPIITGESPERLKGVDSIMQPNDLVP